MASNATAGTAKLKQYTKRLIEGLHARPVLAVIVFFLLVPAPTFNFSLATFLMIFALFASAYGIVLGRTGIVTFGHAAFFGGGAYGTALFVAHLQPSPMLAWLGFATGVGLATLLGVIIGWFALRRRGVYLALITLAFAQLVYFVAFQWTEVTGGDNGLYGISAPALTLPGVGTISFSELDAFYFLALVVVSLSLFAIKRLYRSNLGKVFVAIRENEQRTRYLGYDVDNHMLTSFTISAAFAGLAGTLYAFALNFVGVGLLHWSFSGEVNFHVILGGVTAFAGPAVGAILYYLLKDTISLLVEIWELPVGLIFIAIVLFLPDGLIGTLTDRVESTFDVDLSRQPAAATPAEEEEEA